MFYLTDDDAVESVLDAAIHIAKRSQKEARSEPRRDDAKRRKEEARLDKLLDGLQRDMRRRAATFGLTGEAQYETARNAIVVCGWHADLMPEECVDGLSAGSLTRSLAIAMGNQERTPAESGRLRLACIEAGALAMLLGEKRPGIE